MELCHLVMFDDREKLQTCLEQLPALVANKPIVTTQHTFTCLEFALKLQTHVDVLYMLWKHGCKIAFQHVCQAYNQWAWSLIMEEKEEKRGDLWMLNQLQTNQQSSRPCYLSLLLWAVQRQYPQSAQWLVRALTSSEKEEEEEEEKEKKAFDHATLFAVWLAFRLAADTTDANAKEKETALQMVQIMMTLSSSSCYVFNHSWCINIVLENPEHRLFEVVLADEHCDDQLLVTTLGDKYSTQLTGHGVLYGKNLDDPLMKMAMILLTYRQTERFGRWVNMAFWPEFSSITTNQHVFTRLFYATDVQRDYECAVLVPTVLWINTSFLSMTNMLCTYPDFALYPLLTWSIKRKLFQTARTIIVHHPELISQEHAIHSLESSAHSTSPSMPIHAAFQIHHPPLLQWIEQTGFFHADDHLFYTMFRRDWAFAQILSHVENYRFCVRIWGHDPILQRINDTRGQRKMGNNVEDALWILRDLMMNGMDVLLAAKWMPTNIRTFHGDGDGDDVHSMWRDCPPSVHQVLDFCKEMHLPLQWMFQEIADSQHYWWWIVMTWATIYEDDRYHSLTTQMCFPHDSHHMIYLLQDAFLTTYLFKLNCYPEMVTFLVNRIDMFMQNLLVTQVNFLFFEKEMRSIHIIMENPEIRQQILPQCSPTSQKQLATVQTMMDVDDSSPLYIRKMIFLLANKATSGLAYK